MHGGNPMESPVFDGLKKPNPSKAVARDQCGNPEAATFVTFVAFMLPECILPLFVPTLGSQITRSA